MKLNKYLTRANGVKALLSGLCMLLLFNLLLSYLGFKSEIVSTFRKLSIRKEHKYASVFSGSSISSPAVAIKAARHKAQERPAGNSTIHSISASVASISKQRSADTASMRVTSTAIHDLQGTNNSISIKPPSPHSNHADLYECKFPDVTEGGPISPNITLESLDVVEAELLHFLNPGGAFEPKDCKPKDHVAIVVPFRDRYAHLSIFLRNIHPFLMKQHIAYRIFIVEQTNGKAFNRAAMMNIGFLEALKIYPWDCFIFHDVDLLPLDGRNLYNCPRQPRHMSVAIDTFNFKLPYESIFGGVSAMTRQQFQRVNGFSNSYFGWGAEDDDMSNRLKHANLFIARYPINIARYMMLKHHKEKANPKRYEHLVNGLNKIEMDGINSIKYDIYSFKEFLGFTWYLAEIKIPEKKS